MLLQISRRAFPFHRLLCVAAFFLSLTSLHAAAIVPARPENYLLDQGTIFPPEVARRMEDALKACARDYDVHIYVMTVPSFKVMPSRVGEKISELLQATRTEWLKGKVGAVIIFDDEAGVVAMGESAEARNVFSPVALNMLFKDPRLQSKKKRNAPDKLAGAVSIMIQELTNLRAKANDEARKRRTMNLVFASIGGCVVLGGAGLFMLKRRGAKAPYKTKRRRLNLNQ